MFVAELAPGSSLPPNRFALRVPVSEFLGDSLSPGRYRFVARLKLNKETLELSAGEVQLRR
jgi:hypothetical protein